MAKDHTTPEKESDKPTLTPETTTAEQEQATAIPVKVVANTTATGPAASEHPGAIASRKADAAATKDVKEPKTLDFGSAGKLKIVSSAPAVMGNGSDVVIEVEEGVQITLPGVQTRFLK